MTANVLQAVVPSGRVRWYRLTPDRLVFGLLAVEGLLVLSEWFGWFSFNGQTWTVLISFAAVGLALVVMFLWFVMGLLFRWRFQYGIRLPMLLTVAIAVACSWLAVEMRNERRQWAAAEAIVKAGGIAHSEPTWLGKLLRDDSLVRGTSVDLTREGAFADATLAHVQGLKQLQQIYLNDTKVTDAGLVHLQGLKQLQRLYLNGTKVTDAGLVHLQGLKQLQIFWLDHTNVSGAGLVHLQELHHLQVLRLDHTKVTDAGLVHLQGLNRLEVLRLDNAKVTDAGLVHLQGLNQLKMLDLTDTQVTDAGLVHVREIRQLQWVSLLNTKVTGEGVKKLQQALPNCQIIR
jgi:Leucine-rich repeat (LRR) protein